MLPVTQQFSLSWKPEIRFFERRLDPLKRFEEQGRAHSFSVRPADISVHIDSRYQEIRYGSSGLTIRIADAQADAKAAFEAASEVFRIFEPSQIGLGRVNLQFLDALEGDYDELRLRWGAKFVSPPEGISISDWALLINPDVLATQPQWGGAMEFGVVQGDEAAPRLAREVGKLSNEEIGEPSDRLELPEVAFFADANFASVGAIADGDDDLVETSLTAWITIREKISELATKIKDDFVGGESA
jgi:hypothetical protein